MNETRHIWRFYKRDIIEDKHLIYIWSSCVMCVFMLCVDRIEYLWNWTNLLAYIQWKGLQKINIRWMNYMNRFLSYQFWHHLLIKWACFVSMVLIYIYVWSLNIKFGNKTGAVYVLLFRIREFDQQNKKIVVQKKT